MKSSLLYFITLVILFNNLVIVSYAQKQCPNAPAEPQDRRKDKTKLTIATYNTEWLFLNRSNCPGTGCAWPTVADAQKHMADVAIELEILNADIVNLAEVQDCYVLTQLNEILTSKGMGYLPYLLTGTDTSTGQNVALLTRVDPVVDLQRTADRADYPVLGSTCGSTYSGNYGVSKHYFTTFHVEGLEKPLSIFGLHLLAFPDDVTRCVQREAQATVIQQLVAKEIGAGNSVIVMGDLNDFDSVVADASGNIPISSVLQILRDPIPAASGDEMTNVASLVSSVNERYSCWYDRDADCNVADDELSMIDHLLISSDLVPLVSEALYDHSYGPACHSFQSDHWPAIVHLNL